MKKNEIKIGGLYVAKVSDRLVTVRIDSTNSHGGWNATNTATGKRIHVKSAQRLRSAAGGRAMPAGTQAKKQETPEAGADEATDAANASAAKTGGTKAKAKATTKASKSDANADAKATGTKGAGKARKPGGRKATSKTSAKADAKPRRVSALDAAAQVLASAGQPMNAKDLITAMADQGLWTSPGGRTPHATLYAAMLREIAAKGSDARFRKVDRGQFSSNAC
jgi:hypothetical protein